MVNSRAKGARVERLAAALLREVGVEDAARDGQQYTGTGNDLRFDHPALRDIHIEVKGEERPRFYAYLEQALRDCEGKLPVVMWKQNRKDFIVLIDARRFFDYLIATERGSGKISQVHSAQQMWLLRLKKEIKNFLSL